MRTSFRQTLIATTAMLALGTFAASAAPPAAGDPPNGVIQAAAPADHDITGRVEQRIAELHATLKITPAQEPQWAPFVLIMRDNAHAMDRAFQHRVTGMPAMNAADNMQSYADVSMQHAQGMEKLVPAFRTLYATLSAEQKRLADDEFVDNAHHGIDKPKG